MPDMNDLPNAPESLEPPEATIERLNRMRAELEELRVLKRRLMTHEAEADYWRSDEAMEND